MTTTQDERAAACRAVSNARTMAQHYTRHVVGERNTVAPEPCACPTPPYRQVTCAGPECVNPVYIAPGRLLPMLCDRCLAAERIAHGEDLQATIAEITRGLDAMTAQIKILKQEAVK